MSELKNAMRVIDWASGELAKMISEDIDKPREERVFADWDVKSDDLAGDFFAQLAIDPRFEKVDNVMALVWWLLSIAAYLEECHGTLLLTDDPGLDEKPSEQTTCDPKTVS